MSPLVRIILGIVVMLIGFFMVWKTVAVQRWTGMIQWAEEKLGSGGTNTFLKFLGVGIIFIGILIATNIISDVFADIAKFIAPKSTN